MTRMFECFERGEPAIGTILFTPGAEWAETLGYAGLDFVVVDLMVSGSDWRDAADVTRAAARTGLTTWIRLPGYPWGDLAVAGGLLAADVMRGLAIGADAITASVSTVDEVSALIHPMRDWHKRLHVWKNLKDRTPAQAAYDAAERAPLVFPFIESPAAIEHLPDILRIEGLPAIFLGMGDLTKALGHDFDDEHPEVEKFLKETIALARENGVRVFANALAYSEPERDSVDWLAGRVARMATLGIAAIWTPSPSFVAQRHYHRLLLAVRGGH